MFNITKEQFYLFCIVLLFLFSAFFGTDFMAIWSIEAPTGLSVLDGFAELEILPSNKNIPPLIHLMVSGGMSTIGMNEWGMRFPSLIILCFGFLMYYRMASKLFSKKSVTFHLALAASSFIIILLGKLGTGDIWLFALEMIFFPLLIIQSKQERWWNWIILFLLSIAIGAAHFLAGTLFIASLLFGFLIIKKGNNKIYTFLGVSILVNFLLQIVLGYNWVPEGFLFNYNNNFSYFVLLTFLGLIAVAGFVPATITEAFKKIQSKEELTSLAVLGVVAGLVSTSFFGHFMFLFLISKQIEYFNKKGYPYRKSIRVLTVLQVIVSFFIALLLMMYGFRWFGGAGFRNGLLLGVPLWGFGILIIVGLFSGKINQIKNGIILSGLVTTLFFWMFYFPLWEAERNMHKEVAIFGKTYEYPKSEKNPNFYVGPHYYSGEVQDAVFNFYRRSYIEQYDEEKRRVGVVYSTPSIKDNFKKTIYAWEKGEVEVDSTMQVIKRLQGRDFPWEGMDTILFVKRR